MQTDINAPVAYLYRSNDELIHYGVKGMKWGVRRDTRILANHRANVLTRRIKDDYNDGKIGSSVKKERIREVKSLKKKFMSDVEQKYKNAKNDAERDKLDREFTKMTVKEVPQLKLKRGMAVVNQIVSTAAVATAAGTGAVYTGMTAVSYGALSGAVMLGATVVDTAATAGLAWTRRHTLDRIS